MAVISTIIAAAGLAVAAGSAYMGYKNSQDAKDSNAAAAANQAAIGKLQAENVDVQRAQAGLQTSQQQLQIQTQKNVIKDQSDADAIRQQAAELDSTRRRREVIRQSIVARAQGLAVATAQGATGPGGSATKQAYASISGQAGVNISGINQASEAGRKLFDINKDITSQYLTAQDQNSTYVSKAATLQGSVFDNQKKVYELGGQANQNYANAAASGTNASMWAGLGGLGLSIAGNSGTLSNITNYLTSPSSPSSSGATSSTNNYLGLGDIH